MAPHRGHPAASGRADVGKGGRREGRTSGRADIREADLSPGTCPGPGAPPAAAAAPLVPCRAAWPARRLVRRRAGQARCTRPRSAHGWPARRCSGADPGQELPWPGAYPGSAPASARARCLSPRASARVPQPACLSAGASALVLVLVAVGGIPFRRNLVGRSVRAVDRPLFAVGRLLAVGRRVLPVGGRLRLQGADTTSQSTTPSTPTIIRMSPIVWIAMLCVDTVEMPNSRTAPTAMSRRPAPILMGSPL